MARYYTIAVDYYSGKAASSTRKPRTAASIVDFIATCSTSGQDALAAAVKTVTAGTSLIVRCGEACDTDATPVYTSTAGAYLFTSSVCRAATHAGLDVTSPFKLTLSAGAAANARSWITSECWRDALGSPQTGMGRGTPKTRLISGACFTYPCASMLLLHCANPWPIRTWHAQLTVPPICLHHLPAAAANGVTPVIGQGTIADNWDMTLATESAPTTTEFMVPRTAATFDSSNKLVLTVDLSQADCRTGGSADANKCGDGKYLVKSVTAYPWSGSGTSTSTPDRKQFTFVGKFWLVQFVVGTAFAALR